MATRVNTKFIGILLIAVITAGGIVGALWALHYRQDATRNLRKGDQFAEVGDWERARLQYGRAARKEPSNREYLEKVEFALLQITPITLDQARELYREYLGILQHRATYLHTGQDEYARVLHEMHEAVRHGAMSWSNLADIAHSMLQQMPADDPDRNTALLSRATAWQAMRATLSTDQIRQIETDLQTVVEAEPESDEAWAALIATHLGTAIDHYINARQTAAREAMERATTTVREAHEHNAVGPRVAMEEVILIARKLQYGVEGVTPTELQSAMSQLLTIIEQADDADLPSWFLADAAGRLIAGGSELIERSIDRMERYVEQNPQAMNVRVQLATLLSLVGRNLEAEQEARNVLAELTDDATRPRVGLRAVTQFRVRALAAVSAFNVAFNRWERAESADRPALLESMKTMRDAVELHAQSAGISRLTVVADGKLAFAQRSFREAVALLEEAISAGFADQQVYRLVATAHESLGNLGLAFERIEQALAQAPNDPQLLFLHTSYGLQLRRFAAVETSLARLEQFLAEHPRVRQLRSEFDLQQAGITRADVDDRSRAVSDAVALASEGEFDEARALLVPLLEDAEARLSVLELLVRIEFNAGERETADRYLQQAMALAPQSSSLRQLRAVMDNEDPVDAIISFTQTLHPDDPGRTALAMLNNLRSFAMTIDQQLAQADAANRETRAATLRQQQARIESLQQQYLEEAMQTLPRNHAGLFEYHFSDALVKGRWEDAERLIAEHNRPENNWNLDNCSGRLFSGRLELLRGNYEAAVLHLVEATQRAPYSAAVWRTLGLAYEQLGNFIESARALERAYNANPNHVPTGQAFVAALNRVGQQSRALTVLTDLRKLVPNNQQIREQYLAVLASSGNAIRALSERLELYADDPDDHANALQLASLLVSVVPTREIIFDPSGQLQYSERAWQSLPPRERQRIISDARRQFWATSDQIMQALAESMGRDAGYLSARAAIMRERGQADQATAWLMQVIHDTPPRERTVQLYLVLAQHLARGEQFEQMIELLRAAQQYETVDDRRITITLGDALFRLQQFEEAQQMFAAVLEDGRDRTVEMKLTDALVQQGRIEQAEQQLERTVTDLGTDLTSWLLAASIAEARAIEARSDGRMSEYDFFTRQVINAIEQAQQMNPRSPAPQIQMARHYHQRYLRQQPDGDRADLNRAVEAIDRAIRVDGSNEQAQLFRVDLLMAQGNERAAMTSLRQYLEAVPSNDRARHTLIQLQLRANATGEAIATVRDAIVRNPDAARWQEQLGDLLRGTGGDPVQITAAYNAAVDLQPTPQRIGKLTSWLLGSPINEPERALAVLRAQAAVVRDNPPLLINQATAEAQLDRRADAERSLRRAYELTMQIPSALQQRQFLSLWMQATASLFSSELEPVLQFVNSVTGEDQHPEILRGIGMIVASGGPDALSQAVGYLRQAVAAAASQGFDDAYRAELAFQYASMLTANGSYQQAVEQYQYVLQISPDHPLANNNYAYVLATQMDDPQTALPHAQRAAEQMPDNAAVRDTLGWTYFLLGTLDEAASHLQRARELGESASILLHLAEVEIARERYDEARQHLQRASQLNPDSQTTADISRLSDDIETKTGRP